MGLGVAVIVGVGVPPDKDRVGAEGEVGLVWQAAKRRAARARKKDFFSIRL